MRSKQSQFRSRSPYPSYNFVKFFLMCLCVKSCTFVVPFSLTNSPGLLFFLDHKRLLGIYQSKKLVNMGWLMPLKLMAGLLINKLAPLTNSGAWGVAVMGNFIFPYHAAPLGFLRVLPPIKSFLGECPSMGNIFFLPIMWLPLPPINYF